MFKALLAASAALLVANPALAQGAGPYDAAVFEKARTLQPKVVAWRRDVHQNPELGNREFRTSKLVAEHLKKLGFEVRTGVAKTGVVGVLKGGKPGGVVALRADMDGLPVEERTGLPFASKAKGEYNGQTVSVMHACGHDAHVAILMGAAELLASMRADIPGTVVVLFQPAEEGAPAGEEGGASVMIREGALKNPAPTAIFGLHVKPGPVGELAWRPGPMMAASDRFEVALKGKQTHGAMPWEGIDMASMTADVITAFNQIAARQVNVAKFPTVLTIGMIQGGMRHNIIPEDLQMAGTLRTFDTGMRKDVMARMAKATASIADRYGAEATLTWSGTPNPVTTNDRPLTERMKPTLMRAAPGKARDDLDYITGAEDFSYYQQQIPGLFYDLAAGNPPGVNHSPFFTIDEAALEVGVRAQALLALDYLSSR
ncbi:amidohydrolase [Phenylobacterium sp.]|jgi:amidohydrolase|uniref:amidohydrolase n=1 Tax=Phenylobacterium sp. TaxID=1871053 RepID=UPI00378423D7